MGGAKRMMDQNEAQRDVAIGIALECGALRSCEIHETVYEGSRDFEAAYKLGNTKFTADKLEGVFKTRRKMTDVIKEVIEDHPAEECPSCAKIRDED